MAAPTPPPPPKSLPRKDGGPAYPNDIDPGMSLREAFAVAIAGDVYRDVVSQDVEPDPEAIAIETLNLAQALTDEALRRREGDAKSP